MLRFTQSYKVVAALLLISAIESKAQSPYDRLWNDAALQQRISEGIEKNRKGNFTIDLKNYKGKIEIEVVQVRHHFNFGANAFMVGGFETAERNKRYEEVFASLFNTASVPFYWKTLEPEKGALRFAANSVPIYRRPPPDAVLAFCNRYGITPKGHTLVWNHPEHSIPKWLPKDTAEVERLIEGRIKTIAERYGASVKTWDVVNEALRDFPQVVLPKDYVYKAFDITRKAFPPTTTLMINEVTSVWQHNRGEASEYYILIKNLLARGAVINAIGLQFHFFNEQLHQNVVAGKAMTPLELLAVLDLYGRFGKPLHVSEITIPTLPNNDTGRQTQARLTRNFYRLWFSHSSVDAIIWWNAVDGTALKGEDKWNGGFVNNDFSPKPSYEVLNALINKEWKTTARKTLTNQKQFSFRGFYGDYVVRIKQGKKTTERRMTFSKNGKKAETVNAVR